jgi:hypothetical protein
VNGEHWAQGRVCDELGLTDEVVEPQIIKAAQEEEEEEQKEAQPLEPREGDSEMPAASERDELVEIGLAPSLAAGVKQDEEHAAGELASGTSEFNEAFFREALGLTGPDGEFGTAPVAMTPLEAEPAAAAFQEEETVKEAAPFRV